MKPTLTNFLDTDDKSPSPRRQQRAERVVTEGRAKSQYPDSPTIQLDRLCEFLLPSARSYPEPLAQSFAVGNMLLHICCGPCATYPVIRLREEGYHVTGFWYNPNIHPWREHEQRRDSTLQFAERVSLPMIWHPDYDMPAFLRRVAGREAFRQRCLACYELRMTITARQAHALDIPRFTTTLLISPHQDQSVIRDIGESAARAAGVEFYFENFRRGWSERGRLTSEYGLYRQQYCGCIYSEWERYAGHAKGQQLKNAGPSPSYTGPHNQGHENDYQSPEDPHSREDS